VSELSRPEWNPVYYHRADEKGIGFDRTSTGTNAIEQYFPAAGKQWEDSNTCDEKLLLWFHHVSWDHKMNNGLTLWDELCRKYQAGVDSVKWMKQEWKKQENRIDQRRHREVSMLLDIQLQEAEWWRNASLLYFQTFSKRPISSGKQPDKTLDYYRALQFPFAPGN
jgi:alpha-glucuronidase